MTAPIDLDSDPGSWRAALDPNASCKACGQSTCGCTDLEYSGVMPPLKPAPVKTPFMIPSGAQPGRRGPSPFCVAHADAAAPADLSPIHDAEVRNV